ncbi:uncharacterized protein BcabD6B2_27910 [Babesia caballi]|uniref:VHS domain-containing protein n=1 Tax=Babesia caballi TaxID=5871 RepID=A0AAV4LW68_BABCB|nr:hypothetical protein, conserved [Babesia caballi]
MPEQAHRRPPANEGNRPEGNGPDGNRFESARHEGSSLEGFGNSPYRGDSHRGSGSGRRHGSQSMSLKSLTSTSLSCAKSLTSKLISMSNTGIQAASSAINSYKEAAAANARKAAMANPNSFLRIAERIGNSNDPIASHRELVAVVEQMLVWGNPPVQLTLERDRYGQPTPQSMREFHLINDFLLEKTLTYVRGRRDCCLFLVKFAAWRMQVTNQPEEVILSLELLQRCVEAFGGYFLALMTKSCMRRFRRLLRMTKLTTSLTGGMKKQLAKLLVGSSNVHPGVPTDVRIHVIKAKVLYMLQLWHDVFLLDQGLYPVFFHGYRDLRERGIRFPQVDPADRAKINVSAVAPVPVSSTFSLGNGVTLPLTPAELETVLATVKSLSSMSPGPEHTAALKRLRESKERIVASINILAEHRGQISDHQNYEEVMNRMLMLNDCVDAHLVMGTVGAHAGVNLLTAIGAMIALGQAHGQRATAAEGDSHSAEASPDPADKSNLLDLDSSSESDNDSFGTFFGDDKSGAPSSKKTDEDYDKFFADFGVFDTNKAPKKTEASRASGDKNYAGDLGSLDFGNPVASSTSSASPNTTTPPAAGASASSQSGTTSVFVSAASSLSTTPPATSSAGAASGAPQPAPTAGHAHASQTDEAPAAAAGANASGATADASSAAKPGWSPSLSRHASSGAEGKKTLNEMMNEFDNMEFDFGHMSMTGF